MLHSCLLFGDEDDSRHAKRELAVANRVWVHPMVGNCGGLAKPLRRNVCFKHMLWEGFRQVLLQKCQKEMNKTSCWWKKSQPTTRKDVAKTLWIMGKLSYQLVQDFWSINSIIRKHVIWTSRWWLNSIPSLPHWADVIATISHWHPGRKHNNNGHPLTCTKHAQTKNDCRN